MIELRRIQQLEQQNALARERERIAKDLHDDLGANLTHLSLLAELAQPDVASSETEAARRRELFSSTQEFARTLKQIIWTTDPSHDNVGSLTAYLCKYAQEFLAAANIPCRFQVPAELPENPLSVEQRHDLFLVLKEALNNVAKHSTATEVWIRASVEGGDFVLVIEDNGCGLNSGNSGETLLAEQSITQPSTLDSHLPATGSGLANMRKRVEAIGGRFHIFSPKGCGTRISIATSMNPSHRRK